MTAVPESPSPAPAEPSARPPAPPLKRHWTLDDVAWDRFEASKVDPDLLKIAKAASLVEYNADTYTAYLRNVFAGDPVFCGASEAWAEEEKQHGLALAKWATLADPSFDFKAAFARFTAGFTINTDVAASVRGSRSGELISRCIVESGTSSYYASLADAADEPVLKEVCKLIAADELRHYKLFYGYLRDYVERENLHKLRRLWIGLSRVGETEDDELAYAYYASNAAPDETYDRKRYASAYLGRTYAMYRAQHLDRAMQMIGKACGLNPQTRTFKVVRRMAWWAFDLNRNKHQRVAA